jgi:hypothetical protein
MTAAVWCTFHRVAHARSMTSANAPAAFYAPNQHAGHCVVTGSGYFQLIIGNY